MLDSRALDSIQKPTQIYLHRRTEHIYLSANNGKNVICHIEDHLSHRRSSVRRVSWKRVHEGEGPARRKDLRRTNVDKAGVSRQNTQFTMMTITATVTIIMTMATMTITTTECMMLTMTRTVTTTVATTTEENTRR